MVAYGAIADDFTGATDLAGNWCSRGLRVGVFPGLPSSAALTLAGDLDAVVIALKIRSAPVQEAVEESRQALSILQDFGARQIYQKYCSTFDSSAEGNIGPVADMLLEQLHAPLAVVVPSFPDNGRSTYRGHLFVGDQLLQDSPMKDHPLTPMRESNLVSLMQRQSRHQVGLIPLPIVQAGAAALRQAFHDAIARGDRFVVVDAVHNADLAVIAGATAEHRLVTGGSGLALGARPTATDSAAIPVVTGRRAILAGSASSATQSQVAHARERYQSAPMRVSDLACGATEEINRLAGWAEAQWRERPEEPVIIYSVGSLADLTDTGHGMGGLIESAFADLAVRLADLGCRQFVVAGGETSGSVVQGLGINILQLGNQLSPGVSWLYGRSGHGQEFNVVLKSGNFGSTDLFTTAWEEL